MKPTVQKEIRAILHENDRRNRALSTPFNPVTGEGSTGKRVKLAIPDFPIPVQYIPTAMAGEPFIRQLKRCGTVSRLLDYLDSQEENRDIDREKVMRQYMDIRVKHDFPFWCATLAYIKNKGGGDDVLFTLNRPQRRLFERLESMRKAAKPIRLILLKARQWGGSTLSQLYMAWLQLVHRRGLNSLIVAHQGTASDEIKDMFDRMIAAYPLDMLHALGETYTEGEPKLKGVGKSGNIYSVPQRNCKIKIGTAERPDSCRGGDYNLVHLSEVAFWKATDGKKPEDIVRSACSGVLYEPLTMIVYESTANGTGNFFHREYTDAKRGISQFEPLFIAWYDIEKYTLPLEDKTAFARRLWENRDNTSEATDREESGRYLWTLWKKGATLEAIHWYTKERSKHASHAGMASEYPSDDIEAFQHSGQRVFDIYRVEELRHTCCKPKYIGEVYARGDQGEEALQGLKFKEDKQGLFWIWEKPEEEDTERVTDRYLTIVDVGGRSGKSDWSVILVIDRLFMMDGGPPQVVAQWYGHCDIDLLAWRAAQIAAYYNNSLLVIESNTLETHDKDRDTEGDQSLFILNQIKDVYPNLYARKQSEADIREGLPVRYGFHTNVLTKPMIISTLVKVIRERLYIERDERCIDEYLCYEKKKNGKSFGAIEGKHDDLLMTRAIGLHIAIFEMETPTVVPIINLSQPRRKKTVTAATL